MKTTVGARGALLAAVAGLLLPLAACGSDDETAPSPGPTTTSAAPTTEPADTRPFGAGCAGILPAEGPGSADAIAGQPVASAAATVPALSALVGALQAAHLAESLDSQREVTVLAPVNGAFEAIPPEVAQPLTADTARLTAVLTHHVVQGRLAPAQLVGEHTTLNNDEVTVEGEDEQFAVPAAGTLLGQAPATVVCGNLQTANATVYLIDQVLAPAG